MRGKNEGFFKSEVVRAEDDGESSELQEKFQNVFRFSSMSERREKLFHVSTSGKDFETKQQILYTRLSFSDDPEAREMKNVLLSLLRYGVFPLMLTSVLVFKNMTRCLKAMRQKIDIQELTCRITKSTQLKSKLIRRIQCLANLKSNFHLGSLTSKLVKEVEKMNNTGGGGDERLWKPEMDKTGNGYAVIRFLPAPDGEELPWAKMYSHAFQGPGGWYIENSLTTNGGKDPVSEYNRELWNSGIDADKETVRKQKRKLSYYANIYVVQDKANPQNEGQVFLYKFGKKIFDKIMEAMQPEFEDETAINPFDFWQVQTSN